jgi:hypothetical protein
VVAAYPEGYEIEAGQSASEVTAGATVDFVVRAIIEVAVDVVPARWSYS